MRKISNIIIQTTMRIIKFAFIAFAILIIAIGFIGLLIWYHVYAISLLILLVLLGLGLSRIVG
jgi:hypothetical protein